MGPRPGAPRGNSDRRARRSVPRLARLPSLPCTRLGRKVTTMQKALLIPAACLVLVSAGCGSSKKTTSASQVANTLSTQSTTQAVSAQSTTTTTSKRHKQTKKPKTHTSSTTSSSTHTTTTHSTHTTHTTSTHTTTTTTPTHTVSGLPS